MPPRIALSLDSDATAPRALEQVLRDRHEHVFVLRSDDPIGDIDAAAPDLVVVTGQSGAELAQAIRARYGDQGPRIIAVFPECEDAPAGSFDEHIAGPLCARTVAGLLARRELSHPSPDRVPQSGSGEGQAPRAPPEILGATRLGLRAPSTPEPGSDEGARS